jgi:hypothetical protein
MTRSRGYSRPLAAVTGLLWIALAAVRSTRPMYWSPVTSLDHAAVGLFSGAMLGLGLCLWLASTSGPAWIAARIATAAAITNGGANFLEDWLLIRSFGNVWVLSAFALAVALIALAALSLRAGARMTSAVAAMTVVGLFFIEAGGAALVGAAWLAVALPWPPYSLRSSNSSSPARVSKPPQPDS